AEGDPGCRSPPRLPAEILPRPQPHRAGLRQVQNLAPKGRGANVRGDLRRLRQNPRSVPARRMRRIPQERRIRVDPKAGRSKITDTEPMVRTVEGEPGAGELVQRRWSWPGQNGKPVYNFRSKGCEFASGRC